MCNNQYKNILSSAGRKLWKNAPRYWNENNKFYYRSSYEKYHHRGGLWFRTEGCTYSKKGSCIMCNYSSGPITTNTQMVDYVKSGLQYIPYKLKYLLVSPSGSMLDEKEVPLEARINILKLLSKSEHQTFGFETRADTINATSVIDVQRILNGRLKEVLIGIETINELYQKFCLNKIITQKIGNNAIQILRKNGIRPAVNVILGIPFLNEKENVAASIETIKWSLNNGANHCYLFPIHVKEGTPLALLHKKKKYSPPSLWSLIEVMKVLKKETVANQVRPSWYTSLDAYNVLSSPTTCNTCYNKIIRLLDHYDRWRDRETLDKLINYSCICRDKWYNNYRGQPYGIQSDFETKIIDSYIVLSDILDISIPADFKKKLQVSIESYSKIINRNGL
jgi:archaeosine synthase beta-subunit